MEGASRSPSAMRRQLSQQLQAAEAGASEGEVLAWKDERRRLLDELRSRGIHTALGGIALPNDASIALHETLGFEKVAELREVGFKLGRWIDVGYWQKILRRHDV